MSKSSEEMAQQITSGSIASLAKAITLAESSLSEHRQAAEALLRLLLPASCKSVRLGISGPPGVGKSSFIEALGLSLIDDGHKVAVLAIDPSSPVSGGSILGDKTRMNRLSNHEHAFIRPSPSSGTIGGVGRRTNESIILCEACGFDIILVETVGVGQADTAVSEMTDFFIQLHQPHSGDDLQGIKKGASEFADLILVTKADGDLKEAAELARSELEQSLHYTALNGRQPKAFAISSKSGTGLREVVSMISELTKTSKANASFERKRSRQYEAWFRNEIWVQLEAMLLDYGPYKKSFERNLKSVLTGKEIAPSAARNLLKDLFSS